MSAQIVYQGIPSNNSPVVTQSGQLTVPWYRFLLNVFKMTGLGTPGVSLGAQEGWPAPTRYAGILLYLQFAGDNYLQVVDQETGALVGYVKLSPTFP